MPVTAYSTTAASNNGAPPNGAPEAMAPSAVNDTIRQIMADIALEAQTNNVKVLKSVSGTNTIAADMDPELAAYVTGMMVILTPANANTGATTINIDGLGAKSIVKGNAAALIANDLLTTKTAVLVYNGTNFELVSSTSPADILAYLLTVDGAGSGLDADLLDGVSSAGYATLAASTFTGTLTGMAGATTGTVSYRVIGGICTLYLAADIAGTSNAITMTMTGLPAACQPSAGRQVICSTIQDNGFGIIGGAAISGSTITFSVMNPSGSLSGLYSNTFTNSGTKGLFAAWTISYPL